MPVLDIRQLTVDFSTKEGIHHVLKNVNIKIHTGEIVGLIGESGSGKSTLALTILDLNSYNRSLSGSVFFNGIDLKGVSSEKMRALRGNSIGFIPQASMNALNPLINVKKQFIETIKAHKDMPLSQMIELINKTLTMVSIDPQRSEDYPFEFSGGQRQRLMIALSLLLSPELIIADEPTTALDVTVQSMIIDLLKNTVEKKHTSMLIISHDLHTISRVCDRIYIMYAGKIVETGTRDNILYNPAHPYTIKLLSSRLSLMADHVKVKGIPGSPPSLLKEYNRCEFLERCDRATSICKTKKPPECNDDVKVACHFGETL